MTPRTSPPALCLLVATMLSPGPLMAEALEQMYRDNIGPGLDQDTGLAAPSRSLEQGIRCMREQGYGPGSAKPIIDKDEQALSHCFPQPPPPAR